MVKDMRHLTICADDYGIAPAVDEAILDLLARRRLQAVSCMTVFQDWPEEARRIGPFIGNADLGLHLTCSGSRLRPLVDVEATAGYVSADGYFLEWPHLLGRLLRRTIRLDLLKAEFEAQVERFTDHLGSPAHLDGHQHAHQFPGIRDLVIELSQGCGPRTAIRNLAEPLVAASGLQSSLKSRALALPGHGLRQRCRSKLIPTNDFYLGGMSFRDTECWSTGFLINAWSDRDGHAIWITHPGHVDKFLKSRDSLHEFRAREYVNLASDHFGDLLESLRDRGGIQTTRFVNTPSFA